MNIATDRTQGIQNFSGDLRSLARSFGAAVENRVGKYVAMGLVALGASSGELETAKAEPVTVVSNILRDQNGGISTANLPADSRLRVSYGWFNDGKAYLHYVTDLGLNAPAKLSGVSCVIELRQLEQGRAVSKNDYEYTLYAVDAEALKARRIVTSDLRPLTPYVPVNGSAGNVSLSATPIKDKDNATYCFTFSFQNGAEIKPGEVIIAGVAQVVPASVLNTKPLMVMANGASVDAPDSSIIYGKPSGGLQVVPFESYIGGASSGPLFEVNVEKAPAATQTLAMNISRSTSVSQAQPASVVDKYTLSWSLPSGVHQGMRFEVQQKSGEGRWTKVGVVAYPSNSIVVENIIGNAEGGTVLFRLKVLP